MTKQSCQPVYPKKPFKAMSMLLALDGMYFFEMFFVADHAFFGDVLLFLCLQPGGEGADIADVFVDGILGFFLCINVILIGLYGIFVDCPHVVSSHAVLIFCPRISGKTGG